MLIDMRNALMAGKRLPYDAEVEYLKTSGQCYICTGVIASNGIIFYGKTMRINSNSVLGWSSLDCITNAAEFRWRDHSVYVTQPKVGQIYDFVWGPDVYLDGVFQGKRDTTSALQAEVVLFARTTYGGDPYNGQTWYIKIENELGLVRDFIPVRFTNENGQTEGAMYDRANPTVGMNPDGSARDDGLYRNRGTGAFSWGNDI